MFVLFDIAELLIAAHDEIQHLHGKGCSQE